jgi:hypothetical protein
VRQGAAPGRARCRADGGPEHRLATQRKAGAVQPRSVLLSVAALTGPPTAAQTGIPMRPLVCEPVVAWTPRRQRLGGVCDGAAVDDGGVGPWPARPSDSAASALCRKRGEGSLGNRSGAGASSPSGSTPAMIAPPPTATPTLSRPHSRPYTPRTPRAPTTIPACPVAPPSERAGATAAAQEHQRRGRRPAPVPL